MIKISASMLAADFLNLEKEVLRMQQAGADYLHYDVMDGCFVPNISFGMGILKQVSALKALPMDVHLMIEQPERHIEAFAQSGARIITVHAEATRHLHRVLTQIRSMGCLAGVSLNPGTSEEALKYVLGEFDLALVMTVNPGFGGQKLIPATLNKVEAIRKMLDEAQVSAHIEVDGGVGADNAGELTRRGADILVAGSALFGAKDPAALIQTMRG
jgi:ribulose-phosphate 3-epimerase